MATVLKQRSMAWREKRLGMVTASRFDDVLTNPKTKAAVVAGEMSKTAEGYLHELLAEMLTSIPCDRWESQAMRWGTQWESEAFGLAKEAIEQLGGKPVSLPVGENAFLLHQEEDLIGCSPDGIIGDEALLEIKCGYNPRTHLQTVLGGWMPEQHKPQVQGSLWISGRQHYMFVSYDPRYRGSAIDALYFVQVKRDDHYIDHELAPKVLDFRDTLRDTHARLMAEHLIKNEAPF